MNEDNKKVLIVDDDRFLVDMYSIKFTEGGYEVQSAMSAKEALDLIDQGLVPRFCLIDVIMSGMDGFSLITELKKRESLKDSVIIFLTNLGQQDDIDKGMKLGANGYIVKASATPSEVVSKVLDIVNNK